MNERVLPGAARVDERQSTRAGSWRGALLALVGVLVAIIVLYRETAQAMVEIWLRSETFTHGFLVLPITLWLIWRRRHDLAALAPRASVWGLLALAAAGFAWLLGELATVSVFSQFALTSLLIFAVPAVLGVAVARRIAFPLAFLYFAVPFGEFALPQLMEWTAQFTVVGLRLSGIPVYREGLSFIIPSGSWSVVEACSGVRYLIASFCVGTLFAYLNYRSAGRRLLFIAVSLIVPLLANWLRAYMIVMIGHYSGNQLAVGVDHLIYGWVFFGLVIGAMFSIGSRWREDDVFSPRPAVGAGLALPGAHRAMIWPSAVLAVALAAVWPLAQAQIERHLPSSPGRLEALGPIAGWSPAAQELPAWRPGYENTAAILAESFAAPPRAVGLYIAYYRKQDAGHKMVTTSNALVRAGDPLWGVLSTATREITLDRQALALRSARLRSSDSSELVAWQWYWVNGRLTASDYLAKAYSAFSNLAGQGDDSAVIVVYTANEPSGADAALQDFVLAGWPEIERVLRRAGEQR